MAYNQVLNLCEKVQGTLSSLEYQYEFLRVLHQYNTGKITKNELENEVVNVLGKYPDLLNEFNEVLKYYEDIGNVGFVANHSEFKKSETDKFLKAKTKTLKVKAKGCVSKFQTVTPSYRLKPRDDQKTITSQRPSIAAQVLNDKWICVASSDEKYSTKPRLTNPYEEALNQYEDDQYEFDMLLNYFRSAIKNVEKLLEGINNKEISLGNCFKVEDHLNALNLRCIERMYGFGGPAVLERLHQEPMAALPIIFHRLKEKIEELEGRRVCGFGEIAPGTNGCIAYHIPLIEGEN